MTGNWDLIKFRDIQVAEDIGKRAELGWFDVEFTMYGCAYLSTEDQKMYYKVSSRAEDIYSFIETSVKDDVFPSKVEEISLKCPVPVGMKELIAKDIKRELAKQLRIKYSKDFFVFLHELVQNVRCNHAAEILWDKADKLEGKFDTELLRQYEKLVQYSYGCQKINKEDYEKIINWIAAEYKNMDENFTSKDIFEKTIYGFAYEDNDKVKFVENARKEVVYEKAYLLEQKGLFVTPVFDKTFWYNYEYRLSDVIDDFKIILRKELDTTYRTLIKEIRSDSCNIKSEDFEVLLEEVKNKWGENCAETLVYYGYHWGILRSNLG